MTPPEAARDAALGRQVARGTTWSVAELVIDKVGNFVAFILVVRLLPPEVYGSFALAQAVLLFGVVAADLGLTVALVQRPEVQPGHLDAAFWSSMAAGAAFAVVVGGLAWGLSGVVDKEPEAYALFAGLAVCVVLVAVGKVQKAMLTRDLDFRRLTVRAAAATVSGGVVGVVLVRSGAGVWALVAQQVVYFGVGSAALWALVPWRPSWRFSADAFRQLWAFGRTVTASQSLDYVNRRADTVLVGVFLGSAALGVYSVAYKLVLVVSDGLLTVINALSLPAFSRLQGAPERLAQAYGQAVKVSVALSLPLLVGLAAVAPTAVPLVFGAQWAGSVPILYALVALSAAQVVYYVEDGMMMALGRSDWRLRLNLAYGVSGVAAFVLAMPSGVVAVAWALAARGVAFVPVGYWLSRRLAPLDIGAYLGRLAVPVLGAVVVWVAAWAAGGALGDVPAVVRLAGQVAAGAAGYAAVWVALDRAYVLDLFASVRAPVS